MSWNDFAAAIAIVKTVPILAAKTYVTVAPKPTPPAQTLALPYVIAHPDEGISEQQRLTGPPVVEHPEITLHIVGESAEQVLVVLGLIKKKFVVDGFVIPPTVAGRRNRDGYWRMPTPVQTDNDSTPPLLFAVVELGWTSEPA